MLIFLVFIFNNYKLTLLFMFTIKLKKLAYGLAEMLLFGLLNH